jgi:hypothetical protein
VPPLLLVLLLLLLPLLLLSSPSPAPSTVKRLTVSAPRATTELLPGLVPSTTSLQE